MNHLWGRAVEVLNNKSDPKIREARFRELFHADFDCPGIARFVLGRYWRNASEEEQQEFVKLFEDYVVFVYATRLSNFGGETIKVRGSRSDGDGVIVSTDVSSPGGASPLKIDWRLVTENGAYKISDVIVEGRQHDGHPALRIRVDRAAQRRPGARLDRDDARENRERGALTQAGQPQRRRAVHRTCCIWARSRSGS